MYSVVLATLVHSSRGQTFKAKYWAEQGVSHVQMGSRFLVHSVLVSVPWSLGQELQIQTGRAMDMGAVPGPGVSMSTMSMAPCSFVFPISSILNKADTPSLSLKAHPTPCCLLFPDLCLRACAAFANLEKRDIPYQYLFTDTSYSCVQSTFGSNPSLAPVPAKPCWASHASPFPIAPLPPSHRFVLCTDTVRSISLAPVILLLSTIVPIPVPVTAKLLASRACQPPTSDPVGLPDGPVPVACLA
ncbi:uncharacterized protein BDZ83DRAFT_763978 [Colletotrichum acutatum]|uniref:Uncharacterized protein n=1 Tax=Glomerella acutata TaxID=27357 RepID=A0AAD8XKF2_GLOAC|nr:uncharacterized protein BDZ83DRAFT_763978 [Colletotrichum acutatum]KAK1729003.1 hypothetical protein BDZ83DRAFT_763978 [Colletotrichum acutatum]